LAVTRLCAVAIASSCVVTFASVSTGLAAEHASKSSRKKARKPKRSMRKSAKQRRSKPARNKPTKKTGRKTKRKNAAKKKRSAKKRKSAKKKSSAKKRKSAKKSSAKKKNAAKKRKSAKKKSSARTTTRRKIARGKRGRGTKTATKSKRGRRGKSKRRRKLTAKQKAAQARRAEKRAAKLAKSRRKAFKSKLRRCKSRSAKRSRRCRKLFAAYKAFSKAEKARVEALKKRRYLAKMKRKCRSRRHKRSKVCRKFLAERRRKAMYDRICGRRYGRARRRESIARFARRYRVSEGTVRRLNNLGKARRLRYRRRYLVYRSPWDGQRLHGGKLLGARPGVFAMQRPQRGWGKPFAVDLIAASAEAVHATDPLASRLVVGDLSKKGGGCIPPHRSHRGGLDADIGYYMLGGKQRGWLQLAQPETIDADRTWRLLKGFLVTRRLQYAFIDYGLQRPLYEAALRHGESKESLRRVFQYPRPRSASKAGIIRHLRGHADHMHVRFMCPNASCTLPDAARSGIMSTRANRHGGAGRHARSAIRHRHRVGRGRRIRRIAKRARTLIMPPALDGHRKP